MEEEKDRGGEVGLEEEKKKEKDKEKSNSST